MAANNILPFCPTDTGTNLLTQSAYLAADDRDSGNKPGIASAKLVNKAIRQSAFIASQIAQFLADKTGIDVLDDANTTALLATMNLGFGSLLVASKTANYVLTKTDQLVLGNTGGGAFSLTLPTAVGATGKVYTLKKTSNDFTALTIATTSAQTIDGLTTRILSTLGETLQVISDGANWQILAHKCDTDWVAYSPTLVGFGTPSNVSFLWRRVGGSLEVLGDFTPGTATAVEARLPFPTGLTSSAAIPTISIAGSVGTTSGSSSTIVPIMLREPSVTYFTFGYYQLTNNALTKVNGNAGAISGQGSVIASCPIDTWFT